MIRLASKATLLSAVALVVAGAALAGVPNATNSTINAAPNGPRMVLMGTNGSGAAFGGVSAQATCTANAVMFGGYDAKVITVRDAANNPVANSVVTLNYNACYSGAPGNAAFLSTNQCGASMTLSGRTISGTTNASGVVIFRVAGGGSNPALNGPEATVNCIAVTADGVPLGSLSPAYFDHNGDALIRGNDAGIFSNDLSPAAYRFRSDYNQDGVVNGSDAGLFSNQLFGAFGGNGGGSCGPYVP